MPNAPTTPNRSTWTGASVRASFIDFFKSLQKAPHPFVPSSPVVPLDDPTLLFTNAGMNQFKPLFLGQADPSSELGKLKCAANSQKCIRAGGKHNDLEDVGKDTYHHTFFEMLGNWSFGDYFKAEAIEWAWTLLTQVWGLPKDRLYASYFGGDEKQGLPADDEAKELWLRFLPPERVLPFGAKDNFWEMGDTGPCGPSSEIHFDRVGGRDASELVNADDPSVIEIWNLVFIQFDRQSDGSLKELPAKHVDTGMGLERVLSVLQGKPSNYDTDLFTPIFDALSKMTGTRPYTGKLGHEDEGQVDFAYRVVADHSRALTFAITDGAVPGNEGRGYVLRRILRRAVRMGWQKLGGKPGFLSELVPVIVEHYGEAFPELKRNSERVASIVRDEEESFGRTMERGVKLFEDIASEASRVFIIDFKDHRDAQGRNPFGFMMDTGQGQASDEQADLRGGLIGTEGIDWRGFASESRPTISGADAFQLYDTYGFPLDLTQVMAEERGLAVDVDGFHAAMAEQREQSRAGSKSQAEAGLALDADAIAKLQNLNVKPTEDVDKYHGREIRARVRAIWNGTDFDENTQASGRPDPIGVVFDVTNFYAEAGGQQADHGRVFVSKEARTSVKDSHHGGEFRVEGVKAYGGYVMHAGQMIRGELRVGDEVTLNIDNERRLNLAANHTTTHLFNYALREVVGGDTPPEQRGSMVAPDRMRFDFDASGPISPADLGRMETIVRQVLEQDHPVYADLVPQDKALEINGLRAVFGEKYPNPVRVVSIGAPIDKLLADPKNDAWMEFSVELCGGTHLATTAQAESFAIVHEEGVAKGIRRVVAVTRQEARRAIAQAHALAVELDEAAKVSDEQLEPEIARLGKMIDEAIIPVARKAELRGRLGALQDRAKAARKALAQQASKKAVEQAKTLAQSTGDGNPVVAIIDALGDRGAMQSALTEVRKTLPDSPIMLLSLDPDNKVALLADVPQTAISRGLKAGDWVRAVAQVVGGKGGGKPNQAQGGGPGGDRVREAADKGQEVALASMA
ncbi:MAG: alanine--tRNA ligase [Phycisphaerales bacterium]